MICLIQCSSSFQLDYVLLYSFYSSSVQYLFFNAWTQLDSFTFQISCLSNSTKCIHGRNFVGQYFVACINVYCIKFSYMVS